MCVDNKFNLQIKWNESFKPQKFAEKYYSEIKLYRDVFITQPKKMRNLSCKEPFDTWALIPYVKWFQKDDLFRLKIF